MAKATDYPLSSELGTIGRALHVLNAQGTDPVWFLQTLIDNKAFREEVGQLFRNRFAHDPQTELPEVPFPEGLDRLRAEIFGTSNYKQPDYVLVKSFIAKLDPVKSSIVVLTFGLADGIFRTEANIAPIIRKTTAFVAWELIQAQKELRNMLADHRHRNLMIATDSTILAERIEEIGLKAETVRQLKVYGIHTTLELCVATEEQLLGIPEFGMKRVIEVKETLGTRALGLTPPHRY